MALLSEDLCLTPCCMTLSKSPHLSDVPVSHPGKEKIMAMLFQRLSQSVHTWSSFWNICSIQKTAALVTHCENVAIRLGIGGSSRSSELLVCFK